MKPHELYQFQQDVLIDMNARYGLTPPTCIKCDGRVFRTDGCDYSNVHLGIVECIMCGQDQNAPVRTFKKIKMCEQAGCLEDGRRVARGRWLCGKDHDRESVNVPSQDQKDWASGHMVTDTSTSDIWRG